MERIWYVRAYNRAVDRHFVTRGKDFKDTVKQYEEMLDMNRKGQNDTEIKMCSISSKQLAPKPKELNYTWEI